MNKAVQCTILLILFTFLPLFSQSRQTGSLEITFHGLRNYKGQIAVGINHENPEGFPRKADIELQFKKDEMKDGALTVQVKDLAYGLYAISVLDDENCNLEMEMFLGIPKEGFGFSTNPPFKLRTPKFEECAFIFSEHLQKITIKLRYTRKDKNPDS